MLTKEQRDAMKKTLQGSYYKSLDKNSAEQLFEDLDDKDKEIEALKALCGRAALSFSESIGRIQDPFTRKHMKDVRGDCLGMIARLEGKKDG